MPPFPSQAHYDMLSSATSSGPPYNKPPTENGGGVFSNPLGANGAALGRSPMSMLPLETLQSQPANHGVPVALPPAADGSHVPSPFHEHGMLRAAAPEMLTQMGYRRPQGYGPEGGWNNGVSRSQAGGMSRMDAGPPVLVLQPGWGVSLPPYFLGVMDPKRSRHVPVKVSRAVMGLAYSMQRTKVQGSRHCCAASFCFVDAAVCEFPVPMRSCEGFCHGGVSRAVPWEGVHGAFAPALWSLRRLRR